VNKESLLVVDQESEVLQMVKSTLKDDGYDVICAQSTMDALNILRKKVVDILMTSLAMPDISGLELLKQAHVISPSTGSIIICKNDTLDTLFKSFQAGAQAIIIKPFDSQDLRNVVGEVAQKSLLEKENIRLRTLLPLFELNKSIISELNAGKIFNHIVRIVCIETRAEKVSLLLLNETADQLIVKSAIGLNKNVIGRAAQPPDDQISWSVIKLRKALLINPSPRKKGTRPNTNRISALCVPLSIKGMIIGVINCSKSNGGAFTESDLELLSILAGQAAIAIENAKLFNDVTEHKSSIEMFLRKNLTAQEDERKRISSELHDSLAQWIVSASYSTQLSDSLITMSKYDEARIEIKRTYKILDQSIKELRRVILDLHPVILSEMGLVEAIKQHMDSFFYKMEIKSTFKKVGIPRSLAPTQDIVIYRIVLEALNNIRKHAKATRVAVVIRYGPSEVLIKVEDDGCGFDLPATLQRETSNGNIGLLSMRERAEMAGGSFNITSVPGKGTKIIIRIPTKICIN
jgi:signal transduction histidine kinase/FixJ family two-component response regulator